LHESRLSTQNSAPHYHGVSMKMTESELCRLLIDCLKKDGPALDAERLSSLAVEDWQALSVLATAQRVKALLWHRLRKKGLDRTVPVGTAEELREFSLRNGARNLRLYGELKRLVSSLKPEGIPLILLKGILLAEGIYGNIELREMNDIDVLARPADLARITDILTDMGYGPSKTVWTETTLQVHQHVPRMIKNGYASFEIHWNLTAPGESYSIDPEGLWERAAPVRIAGLDALALSPEDLLLHLCLHTSYQHQFAFGLRPSCDIAETIASFGASLDWKAFTERAVLWGWERGAYLALMLARALVSADVPVHVLERLRPADMTDALLETARTQVFCDKTQVTSIPTTFAELLESRRFWERIRIFWQRVFLSKTVIAAQYSVSADSLRIYACYPRRFVDILRRHGRTLQRYQQSDASLKALVERKNRVARWLAGPPKHP
jgi:hypothetical protein